MPTIAELMFEAKHGKPPNEEDKQRINEFLQTELAKQTSEQRKAGKQFADKVGGWLIKFATAIKERDESMLRKVANVSESYNDPITGKPVFEFVDMDKLDAVLTVDERKYLGMLLDKEEHSITVPSIGGRGNCIYRHDVENFINGSKTWD